MPAVKPRQTPLHRSAGTPQPGEPEQRGEGYEIKATRRPLRRGWCGSIAACLAVSMAQYRAAVRCPSGRYGCCEAVCLADFETIAQQRLTPEVYAFISGGAADELTVRWNQEALERVRLRSRVLW